MRAWLLNDTGGPNSFTLGEIPTPDPAPEEVRVSLRTSGLNHLDLWVSMGLPAPKTFPHVAGGDGAGIVDAIGSEVGTVSLGDEVIVNPSIGCGECSACLAGDTPFCRSYGVLGEHLAGTLADFVIVPARNVVPKPASLSWEEAGAFGLAFGTAFRMLRRSRLTAGGRLLVVGVGGGVASAGLLLGVAMGARVFVTSRDRSKIDRAIELGAEAGFDSGAEFSRSIKETAGGVDVVLDSVGPATFEQSLRSLALGGRLVISGGTSGTGVSFKVPYLFFNQLEIIGSTMFDHREFEDLTRLVGSGKVEVVIDSVFEFEELPEALARMDAAEQFGKLVISH